MDYHRTASVSRLQDVKLRDVVPEEVSQHSNLGCHHHLLYLHTYRGYGLLHKKWLKTEMLIWLRGYYEHWSEKYYFVVRTLLTREVV